MRFAPERRGDHDALAAIEAQLAAAPNAIEVQFRLACCLEDLAQTQAAMQAYVTVLAHDRDHLGALTNLGLLLREGGNVQPACALFERAASHHPGVALAHVNLGETLLAMGRPDRALRAFRAALARDPELAEAHYQLALVYANAGDATTAERHLVRATELRAVWTVPFTGSVAPVRVLLLNAGTGGGIITAPFLDDRTFATTILAPHRLPPGEALPEHDLVFNGIGDADRCHDALQCARELVARSRAPAINDPSRVLATGRESTARRLGALARVRVPRIALVERARVRAASLVGDGWRFPLLIRAPGFHAGRHFELVSSADELDDIVASMPGEALFVLEYFDARGADGLFRKYRMLAIDGVLFPVHLALSHEWKVHYFSAAMDERAEYRAEEQHFLDDPGGALGPATRAAVQSVMATLALDYAGIDFGVDGEGNVIVFEANAAMAVYPPAPGARWSYRRPAYDAVIAAVRGMLLRRAGREDLIDAARSAAV